MRWVLAAVAAAGCNQVFGLAPTEATPTADAQYFDAPMDAAWTCPAIGESIAFDGVLHSIGAQCLWFSSSKATQKQYAACNQVISESDIDGTFAPVPGLAAPSGTHLDLARISPDGATMYVRRWDDSVANSRMLIYTRGTDGAFSQTGEVTITGVPFVSFITFSAPSGGPMPRMLVRNGSSADLLEIQIGAGGVATLVDTYTAADFDVSNLYNAGAISVDGLRMMGVGSSPASSNLLIYADRATLGGRFGMARNGQALMPTADLYFDEDCARLYTISGGISAFWMARTASP